MKIFLFIAAIIGLTAPAGFAGGDEVIVIYNSKLPASKSLAEYYAQRRQVPADQVFGFSLPTGEEISRADFRDKLQKPLAAKLVDGKLWSVGPRRIYDTNGLPAGVQRGVLDTKIRYAVLCHGVPLKILKDANYYEPEAENMRPELRRNEACLDSDLACLPQTYNFFRLAGPLANPLYTVTNSALLSPTNGLLMVTRLDGPTPEIARSLVDKALEAERDGLWGRAYFDLRNITDPGYKIGDDWIRGAGEVCRLLGFECVVDEKAGTFPAGFPMSQIAFYAGWYTETVNGPFTLPNVEFMPGAFAYHLHSFSAASLRITNHNWVGPLLAKGVTCTMGTVDEPYIACTPDVGVFAGRWIYHGFTFGEAAYAAQSFLSWQTTVVGDPLYSPFSRNPQERHEELETRKSKLVEWAYLRLANMNHTRGVPISQVAGLLESVPVTKESAVLSEKLADLCVAQGKPSSAIFNYERALKLDPSPQQRIRLRLTLGEKLLAGGRDADAYENYKRLASESPYYTDRLSLLQKLVSLANKLGKKDEAATFEAEVRKLSGQTAAK